MAQEFKPHFEYLSTKEYAALEQYKHYAPKTTYELFMLNNVTTHIEKRLPSSWTANTVTIIGNIALPLTGALSIYMGGLTYANSEVGDLPQWVFWVATFAVQWFSWFDMMDG